MEFVIVWRGLDDVYVQKCTLLNRELNRTGTPKRETKV